MSAIRYRVIGTLLALVSIVAADGNDGEKMRGIGLPVIFMLSIIAAIWMTREQLIMAHDPFGSGLSAWVFRGGFICGLMSFFLYPSAAWGYGLASTMVAYLLAFVSSEESLRRNGRPVLLMLLCWFATLVGLPSAFSVGVINTIHTQNCQVFYGGYADTMCTDGWIVFLLLIATFQVGIYFLILIALMGAILQNDSPHISYGGIRVATGDATPSKGPETSLLSDKQPSPKNIDRENVQAAFPSGPAE